MELLEKHFDTAFAAPDGMEKLRELILTLAVQGKLTLQGSEDLPSIELLNKIDVERERLVTQKKIKKQKPIPEISLEKIPYELPIGWEWVRLGALILEYQNGISKRRSSEGIETIVLRLADITGNEISLTEPRTIQLSDDEQAKYLLVDNDILITRVNGSIDLVGSFIRVRTNEPLLTYCDHFIRARFFSDKVDVDFIHTLSKSSLVRRQIEGKFVTTAGQKTVNQTHIATLMLPLPPLAEQRRIVAKVDQLMARCDELEKLREVRDRLQIKVHMAACDRLLTAPDPDTFTQSWQFITQHFSELYTVKENVAELRKAILQLAVTGKLVPQDPTESPAHKLLEEIKVEKQKLVQDRKTREPILLPEIESNEEPHELPDGWEFVRLGEFGYILGGGTPSKSDSKCWEGTIPWIRPKNMKVDFIANSQDHVSELALSKSTVKLIPQSSLLMVVRGMILAHSFPAAITTAHVVINQDMKALCPYVVPVVNYLLLSTKGRKEYFLSLVERSSHGTCRLETSKLFSTVLALPPLSEQHRIVAKVNQLMTLCDALEQQIDATTQKQTALLNAVTKKI